MTNRQAKVKFPENLKIAAKLAPSDRAEIARRAGVTSGYISEILKGRRRLVDKVKRAIVDLMIERKRLDNALEEIVNQ